MGGAAREEGGGHDPDAEGGGGTAGDTSPSGTSASLLSRILSWGSLSFLDKMQLSPKQRFATPMHVGCWKLPASHFFFPFPKALFLHPTTQTPAVTHRAPAPGTASSQERPIGQGWEGTLGGAGRSQEWCETAPRISALLSLYPEGKFTLSHSKPDHTFSVWNLPR